MLRQSIHPQASATKVNIAFRLFTFIHCLHDISFASGFDGSFAVCLVLFQRRTPDKRNRDIAKIFLHNGSPPPAETVVNALARVEAAHSGAVCALTVKQLRGVLLVS